jgi:putative transposase
MPRPARIVAPGVPHHVTQRGNRRQPTFFRDEDYAAWLRLAAEAFQAADVEVWAYCLMPNHVHVIATPAEPQGLARAVGMTHVRYTRLINAREDWTGYLWQGRFASFPMDDNHLRRCVRYIGLNPVRAGLVRRAIDWRWSSVRAHVDGRADPLLTPTPVNQLLGDERATFFDTDTDELDRQRLRRASVTGGPLGSKEWVESLRQSGDTH